MDDLSWMNAPDEFDLSVDPSDQCKKPLTACERPRGHDGPCVPPVADLRSLVRELVGFAAHKATCATRKPFGVDDTPPRCDCGYFELLARAEREIGDGDGNK